MRPWAFSADKPSNSTPPLTKQVSFSPDAKLLASGSLDKTLKLWDLSSAGQGVLSVSEEVLVSSSVLGGFS
jgi:WD40 repeat protein